MSESALSTSAAMLFERDDARVLETFRRVEFDYVDAIGEVSEADFFRVITERKILDKLAQSYPSPRKRHDVPLWVYMASNLSMRFHGEHHFHAFPFLVRSSSMIEAFGPAMGHKVTHPETGDISLRWADDDGDLDLLSGLCGPPSSTRISGVVADAGGAGAPKNFSQDTATSSRPNASARSRSLSLELAHLVGPSAIQNFLDALSGKRLCFLLPREISCSRILILKRGSGMTEAPSLQRN